MNSERMVVVAGWADTRAALVRWNADIRKTIVRWARVSSLIGLLMLVATWYIAIRFGRAHHAHFDGFTDAPTLIAAGHIFARNMIVLVMHALICVAGYMAAASMPIAADAYTGWVRRMHHLATPLTFAFIGVVTVGSLLTQAWALGRYAPAVAEVYHLSITELLLLVAPHAIPELTAIFLPLGAWLVIARDRQYTDLLAASMLATAVAIPVLAMAALIEVYVAPVLILAAS